MLLLTGMEILAEEGIEAKNMENSGTVLMPGGVRDLLPAEARCKRELENRLLGLFASWGYQEVVTPTFEYYEVLAPAMEALLRDRLYRFIDDRGQIMLLRPDMTTPIARLVSSRLKDQQLPQRFCYVTNIFRRDDQAGQQREYYQAGVELLGAASPEADAEALCLAGEALRLSGIGEFCLAVGQVDVLSGVLEGSGLTRGEQELAKEALSRKDLVAWEQLVASARLCGAGQEIVAALPYLHGGIEILDRVAGWIDNPRAREGLAGLRQVWQILAGCGFREQLSIDLTLLRGLGYYTGIVFEGYAPGVGYPLCGGGRYDDLLSKFGFSCPATGFALSIERIVAALERRGLPEDGVPDFFLIGADSCRLFKKAKALRESGYSVEIAANSLPVAEAIAYASRKGIPHIDVED
ncbi:MAG: ATP phosphoribosyltransferase regulatory subunit [Thermacetogeniaceae bacterium]